MIALPAGWISLADVPVDPPADDARDQLLRELAKPEYAAARPNWVEQALNEFFRWVQSLDFAGSGDGPAGLGPTIIVVLVIVAVVVAFLVFGVPRLGRKSQAAGSLFGESDVRDAAALRTAAETAASSGDFALATAEMFRAIARGLSDRGLVVTNPGTTAHDFAGQAGRAFPPFAPSLSHAAVAFDSVRYLGGEGSESDFVATADLEKQLRSERAAARETVDA